MLIRNISYLATIHGIKSITKLAEILDIPQSNLQRITAGENNDPKYSTLKTIAEYFGCTPGELMECDLMECDLRELDGDSPLIHPIDSAPESKYQNFPPEVQTAVIEVYREIITREIRLVGSERAEDQTARFSSLAESLVKGFSKLIES
jgi:DNA-binding Xre family transcriptional regulator